jgi:hypothetical protein
VNEEVLANWGWCAKKKEILVVACAPSPNVIRQVTPMLVHELMMEAAGTSGTSVYFIRLHDVTFKKIWIITATDGVAYVSQVLSFQGRK